MPGETHGQRSLEGYSQWGLRRVGHELASNSNKNLALRRPILRAKAAKFVITGQVNDDKETVEDDVSLSVATSIHLLSIISCVCFFFFPYCTIYRTNYLLYKSLKHVSLIIVCVRAQLFNA